MLYNWGSKKAPSGCETETESEWAYTLNPDNLKSQEDTRDQEEFHLTSARIEM
ncbi:hypothetical protein BKA82DRAFT_1002738 [Pisolithus tinctorius]|uniref:Uncharacterized protein n=1 Tax=Pisolithus tinctorius Marx 270 TaxID=870435 RepID=A0A0C3NM32_PISTI|nr:hypothetical protein BKA82DRAFT_1002738 [Pisolithus tinctorius]KIO01980.1 hypothetical protein M404DRAFT_1002738 [Pisolithus tinctorius Marx 270]